jgi:hypothetical protein
MAVRWHQMARRNEGLFLRAGHKSNRTLRPLLPVWSAIVTEQMGMRYTIVIAGYLSPTCVWPGVR